MAKFFLVVEPSCLKKHVLKPKCAVTNVDWNNYLRSSQGTTRNFRTFQGLQLSGAK